MHEGIREDGEASVGVIKPIGDLALVWHHVSNASNYWYATSTVPTRCTRGIRVQGALNDVLVGPWLGSSTCSLPFIC